MLLQKKIEGIFVWILLNLSDGDKREREIGVRKSNENLYSI